jgi:hypothetical protein
MTACSFGKQGLTHCSSSYSCLNSLFMLKFETSDTCVQYLDVCVSKDMYMTCQELAALCPFLFYISQGCGSTQQFTHTCIYTCTLHTTLTTGSSAASVHTHFDNFTNYKLHKCICSSGSHSPESNRQGQKIEDRWNQTMSSY